MVISYCFPSCSHTHLIPPKASKHILPSTVTLSTDSCRLLPRRTTFTVCHSLSFSFCPANSISGPLPVTEEGREGIQNHKLHKGERCATHTAHTHQHRFYTVGNNRREENLHVWQCLYTTAHRIEKTGREGGAKTQLWWNKNSSEELGVSVKCLEQG